MTTLPVWWCWSQLSLQKPASMHLYCLTVSPLNPSSHPPFPTLCSLGVSLYEIHTVMWRALLQFWCFFGICPPASPFVTQPTSLSITDCEPFGGRDLLGRGSFLVCLWRVRQELYALWMIINNITTSTISDHKKMPSHLALMGSLSKDAIHRGVHPQRTMVAQARLDWTGLQWAQIIWGSSWKWTLWQKCVLVCRWWICRAGLRQDWQISFWNTG